MFFDDWYFKIEDPVYNLDKFRKRMKNIDNLIILPLDVKLVIEWSPAKEIWKFLGDDVKSSLWKYVHLSRLLRLSWLWKFGGLYLDTDILVLQDIFSVYNNKSFISLQNNHPELAIGNSIIKLKKYCTQGYIYSS